MNAERFWANVEKTATCWIWNGPKNDRGYGRFYVGSKRLPAHRLAYELGTGESPDGWFVCHGCDNPACVNPAHLFLGRHEDNMADMVGKGRARPLRGPANPIAKLSADDVREIRMLLAGGNIPHRRIAERFGVHEGTIQRIAVGKRYASVV